MLTYIKKNLFETWGKVPDNVRLLAFDTTAEESDSESRTKGEAANQKKAQKEEKQARVGDVSLSANEFVYFSGDLYEEAQRVVSSPNEASHLSGWFQGKYYLNTLARGQFFLNAGAGKLRQFGRMGIFLDLARGESRIRGAIDRALTEVRQAGSGQGLLHVFIVASLVGGTGSGMFIDVAHIVRKLVGSNDAFRLHGFLALQNTFQQVLGNDDYSRVYAAFRELSRFQQVLEAKYPIYYAPPSANREPRNLYRGVSDHKLFDFCYLIDSKRNSAPLDGIKPEFSVYPSMAECITMALDPQTSKTYFDAAINETADSSNFQKQAGKALFFSLGTYTYILPVEEIIEQANYRMAMELLGQRLMQIKSDPETGREYVTWDGEKVNLPQPAEQARILLKTGKLRGSGGEVQNCNFTKQMGVEFDAGPFNDPQRVQYMSEQGEALVSWMQPVTVTDTNINQFTENLTATFQERIITLVSNGDTNKEPPDVAPGRIINEISQYKMRKLGQQQRGQIAVGEIQQGLRAWREANRSTFAEFLKIYLVQTLNGEEGEDAITAKTHKLAYVRDVLDALIKAFNEYGEYLKALITARAQRGLIAGLEQSVDTARQFMLQSTSPNLWEKLNGVPRKRQDEYIQAEDQLYYEQRNDLLYQALFDQNSDLRTIVQNFRAQVNDWISVFGLGGIVGPKETNEPGMISNIRSLQEGLALRRNNANDIRVFEYLTDQDYEDRLYKRYTPDEKWRDVLGQIHWMWEHDGNEGGPKLEATWGSIGAKNKPEKLFNRADYQETATLKNSKLLLQKLRRYFDDIRSSETVIERLRDLKGQGVVRELMNSSAPLISYTAGESQRYLRTKNYICINPGDAQMRGYYDGLRQTLDSHAGSAADRAVVALTNPHRCIMLSAAYHLVGEELQAIKEVRGQYINSFIYTDQLKSRHNFPAEISAVRYEKAITLAPIRQPLRLLAPVVVSLLDDEERFRLFVQAWLFGLVRKEAGLKRGQSRYALRLDRLGRREHADSYLTLTPDVDVPQLPDAIRSFVSSEFDDFGNRLIASSDKSVQINIPPTRVEEAIRLRSDAILLGYNLLADDIRTTLESNRDLLNEAKYPDAVEVMTGAMRVYIAKRTSVWLRSEQSDIEIDLNERLLEHNVQWLVENDSKIRTKLCQALAHTLFTQREKTYGRERREILIRHVEQFIDKTLLNLQDETDQTLKDLGAVMHIMLDEMIKRIDEQT